MLFVCLPFLTWHRFVIARSHLPYTTFDAETRTLNIDKEHSHP